MWLLCLSVLSGVVFVGPGGSVHGKLTPQAAGLLGETRKKKHGRKVKSLEKPAVTRTMQPLP